MVALKITTYDELLTATADWLNRADIADQIPVFVTMATAQFNREMRLREMMVRANTTSDLENVELPADWLEHYSLVLANSTSGEPLQYISERESNILKAGGGTGAVTAYTIIGNMIELVPAPGADVDLKMVYYARIPDLGPTQADNWLLLKAPDLYLYATLLQSAPYLKDDQRIALWGQLRAAIIEALRMETEAALRPRSQLTARAASFY